MPSGAYLVGAAYLLATLLATLAGSLIVVRRRAGHLRGLSRWHAVAVLFTFAIVLCGVLPAAFGVLTRGTSVLTAGLLLAVASRVPAGGRSAPDRRSSPPSARASVALAAVAIVAVGGYELAHLLDLISQPVTNVDLLTFHLPGVARFIQTGTLWGVDQFLPGFATAQYPQNGDFVILAAVLPWHNLAFARLPAVAFYVLSGTGVYGLGLELGATRAAALTFTAVALAVPAVAGFALEGLPDTVTLSMLAIGVTFLLRQRRSGAAAELGLGALALGLSLGTKWFGLTAVGVVVVVWVFVPSAPRAAGRRARDYALLLGGIALGGGFWLLRNVIQSGDPLYPKAISLFGLRLFEGSRGDAIDRSGYTIASYLGSPGVLRTHVYPGFRVLVGFAGLLLLGGVAIVVVRGLTAGIVRRLARSERRSQRACISPLLAVALATLGVCVVYIITPGSAYGPRGEPLYAFTTIRWVMPAVVLAAAVCAAAASRIGGAGVAVSALALVAVTDGIRHAPGVPAAALALALALLLLAGLSWALYDRRRRLRRAAGTARLRLGLAVTAIVTSVGLGLLQQRAYERSGYGSYDPVFAWIEQHAASGHRIGLTGASFSGLGAVLPPFGPALGNEVAYVGDVARHSVELPAHRASFQSKLTTGRYDLLMIGLQQPGETATWARELGFRLVAASPNLALYRAPGRRASTQRP